MKLTRDLVFIDIEGTGLDPQKERIVEFGARVLKPDGENVSWIKRFNPAIPIPQSATDIHGIKDEDVKDCPLFSEYADKIYKALNGRDLAGFNLRRYDLPIIDAELRRCGLKLDISNVNIIDCYAILVKKFPHTLEYAVERFCGYSHKNSHSALSDATATVNVFQSQLQEFTDLQAMSIEELSDFCVVGDGKPADLAGKLRYDADGDLCYNFGDNRGKKVRHDRGFAYWMIRKEFPESTLELLRVELDRLAMEDSGLIK